MKKPLNIALSFILYLLLIFLSFLLIFKYTILSEDFVRKQMIKSQYVENLMEEMQPKLHSATIASGFDKNAFDSVISVERMKTDVFFEIGYLYKTDSKRSNLEQLADDLYKAAILEVEKKGVALTPELDSAIKNFITSYVSTYSNGIRLPFGTQVQNFLTKISKAINLILIVTIVLTLIDLVILFAINKRLHVRKLRYCIYALSATVLTLLFLALWIKFSSKIDMIGISSKAIYYFVVVGFNSMLGSIFAATNVLIALLIVFIILRIAINKGDLSTKM